MDLDVSGAAAEVQPVHRPAQAEPAPDCSRAALPPPGLPAKLSSPAILSTSIDIFLNYFDILRQKSTSFRHISLPWGTLCRPACRMPRPAAHRWSQGVQSLRQPDGAVSGFGLLFSSHLPWGRGRVDLLLRLFFLFFYRSRASKLLPEIIQLTHSRNL